MFFKPPSICPWTLTWAVAASPTPSASPICTTNQHKEAQCPWPWGWRCTPTQPPTICPWKQTWTSLTTQAREKCCLLLHRSVVPSHGCTSYSGRGGSACHCEDCEEVRCYCYWNHDHGGTKKFLLFASHDKDYLVTTPLPPSVFLYVLLPSIDSDFRVSSVHFLLLRHQRRVQFEVFFRGWFFLLNFIFASKCYSEWYMLKSVWEWIEHNILPFGKSVSQHMYVMHQEVARRILCTVLYYVCACQTVYWILFASEKMLQMLLMLRTTVAGLRKGGVFMIILGVKFSLKKYV